jgi:putative N6-adenine-specific DNA methylase
LRTNPDIAFNLKALERRLKKQILAAQHKFYLVVPPGFEETSIQELSNIQINGSPEGRGGVYFEGTIEDCWKVHLHCRIPSRVLMRIAEFRASHFSELEKGLSKIPWEIYLNPHTPLRYKIDSQASVLYHEGAIEERTSKIIEPHLDPWKKALPPLAQDHNLFQSIYIRIDKNQCSISIDCSGDRLDQRGYEKFIDHAPLRDNLCAAILLEANVLKAGVLYDPMCGCGSFSLESLLLNNPSQAGALRSFAFQNFPSFRPNAWNFFTKERIKSSPSSVAEFVIHMGDNSPRAISIATQNIEKLSQLGIDTSGVSIASQDFFTYTPKCSEHSLVVLNPPYDERLELNSSLETFYAKLGRHLKRHFKNSNFAVIVPGVKAEKALGLRVRKKILFHNGNIPVAVLFGKLEN